MGRYETKTNQPAPVLAKECESRKIILLEPGTHPLNLAFIAVIVSGSGLVAFSITHEVWTDNTKTRSGEVGNHFAVEVAPYGLAVDAQHHCAIARALVNMMDTQV